jgi:hypothetical protein
MTVFNHFFHKTNYPALFERLERLHNKILSIFIFKSKDYLAIKRESIFERFIENLLKYECNSKSLP